MTTCKCGKEPFVVIPAYIGQQGKFFCDDCVNELIKEIKEANNCIVLWTKDWLKRHK